MSDAIKAALRAAAYQLCRIWPPEAPVCPCEREGRAPCSGLERRAAAAVAAFLRALPSGRNLDAPTLAAAVERAAREGGDG